MFARREGEGRRGEGANMLCAWPLSSPSPAITIFIICIVQINVMCLPSLTRGSNMLVQYTHDDISIKMMKLYCIRTPQRRWIYWEKHPPRTQGSLKDQWVQNPHLREISWSEEMYFSVCGNRWQVVLSIEPSITIFVKIGYFP